MWKIPFCGPFPCKIRESRDTAVLEELSSVSSVPQSSLSLVVVVVVASLAVLALASAMIQPRACVVNEIVRYCTGYQPIMPRIFLYA